MKGELHKKERALASANSAAKAAADDGKGEAATLAAKADAIKAEVDSLKGALAAQA